MNNLTLRKYVVLAFLAIVSVGVSGFEKSAMGQESISSSQADVGLSARGAKTWADNCDRCHNMRDPKEFRDDQWRSIVSHMRVRGGLTGQESRDVLAFLQTANDVPVAAPSTTTFTSAVLNDGGPAPDGQAIYTQTCVVCHGADGKGTIPGVPDFTSEGSPLAKSDTELLRNVIGGFQSPGSFMAMPPKGGNPALTEADVKAVLDYLHSEFGK